jgi:subtilisin family serine protease
MQTHKWFGRAAILVLCIAMMPLLTTALPAALSAPPDKLDPALQKTLEQGLPSDLVIEFAEQADLSAAYGMSWQARGEYVLKTLQAHANKTQAGAVAYLSKLGLKHQTFLAGNELYVWGADLKAAQGLAALPGVAYVRPPIIYYLDPIVEESPAIQATIDWGIVDTKANQFWTAYGKQGEGMVVANIDTGVQYNHPALINQYKCQSNPGSATCWYDPANICGGTPCDNNGHGTHTMGTMVAADDPGLTYIAGMAPNAQWIACKGCESNSCSDFSLLACADWLLAPGGNTNNRPNVVNNSWGGGGGDTWYQAKVTSWRAVGIFPAFSAGNSGSRCGTLGSPGDYQESFASAAHSSTRTIARFSSRGPSAFGHTPYTKPNISAPGVSICSTVPTNSWSCGYSGTSMASPHSAGAAALLWSCNPDLVGQIDQTFQILQDTADLPPAGNCSAPPDGEGNYTYGYGYLNVLAAGAVACGGELPPTPTPTPPPAALPAAPSNLTASAVSSSQINLAWVDNADNETGFEIERCTGSKCDNFTRIATVGANVTTYADTGLSPRTTYRYRVRAYNANGDSTYSNIAKATTKR